MVWDNCLADNYGNAFDCKISARFFDPENNPGRTTWTISSDDNLADPSVAAGGDSFLVGFDASKCVFYDTCNGHSPEGAYAVRFEVQP